MKTFFATIIIILISAFLVSGVVIINTDQSETNIIMQNFKDFESEWKKVEELKQKGLPKSALEIVDKIYEQARAEKNTPQLIKSILYRLSLKSQYEEDFLLKAVTDVNAELKQSVFPEEAILNSILASLYWNYYQNNRYKFLNRSTTTQTIGKDMETWDLNKILDKTIKHYMASLSNSEQLMDINLKKYSAILLESENSKLYRPTLYDFLAHRALDFFVNDESSLTKPAYTFVMNDKVFLLPAEQFIKSDIHTQDSLSLKYYAVLIFKKLLKLHQNDKNPTAFVDADIKRLKFAYGNINALENKDQIYLETLGKLYEKYKKFPVSTEISYEMADLLDQIGERYQPLVSEKYRWEKKKAVDICNVAISSYPESKGAKNCLALLSGITSEYVNLTTEDVVIPGEPVLGKLDVKNISDLYFKVIHIDPWKYYDLKRNNRDEYLISIFNKQPSVKEWKLNIPDESDYQNHGAQINLKEYKHGFYVVLISSNQNFDPEKSATAIFSFTASEISFINNKTGKGDQEFYILNRSSGQPIENVATKLYLRKYDYNSRSYLKKNIGEFKSDKNGYIRIPFEVVRNESFFAEFIKENDTLLLNNSFYSYHYPENERKETVTFFFTDRGIYRPGQTIHFKGIMLEKHKGKYKILSDTKTEVSFYDVNGQKISNLDLKTNEYGSFNASFTAPVGVLNGKMRISNKSGSKYFSVEDYKRPKFEVDFNPVKGSYKLDQQVNVTGKAVSYSGVSIDNADVKFRVVRKVRYPYWGWWYRGYFPQSDEMEIAYGTAITNQKGEFQISFKAIPDLSVNKKYNPVFNYEVTADVTDINGETHSASTTVSVGYKALIAEVETGEKVNITETNGFNVKTTNLNGQFEPADVSVKISRLRIPDKIYRNRKWSEPDIFLMTEDEFIRLFPHDIYKNENEPQTWEVEKTVYENSFVTEEDSRIEPDDFKSWEIGVYKVVLKTSDKFGEELETEKYFSLFSPMGNEIPTNDPDWFTALIKKAEPGEEVSFLFGTKLSETHLIYELILKDSVLKRGFLNYRDEQKKTVIEVDEKYRGNFGVNLVFVANNRIYQHSQTFVVPYTDKELKLEFASFRDKLKPGQKEEWQIKITGMKGEKYAAELLAGMYDASLDVFNKNNWTLDLYRNNNVRKPWHSGYCFNISTSRFYDKSVEYHSFVSQTYDRLNWFGMNWYSYRGYGLERNMALMSVDEVAMDAPSATKNGQAEMPEEMSPPPPGDSRPDTKEGKIEDIGTDQQEDIAQPAQIRTDFRETAFFYPDLKTNDKGEVIFSFTMPEALTRWKMMGLAYTKDLKIGKITKELISQKELMVVPNAPRFFREGDQMQFSVKISSLSEEKLNGEAELKFFNAITMKPVDEQLGLKNPVKSFEVSKGSSSSLEWEISIPENVQAITYRIMAKAGNYSDGEEMAIPVLPNRMLVTESLPMWVRGEQTKEFKFDKLINSRQSKSLSNYKLTLEFSSNPAWYAVQALPYLMEFPYECSEQVFSRYYANSLASYIANSDPKIKRVFESWKNITPDALLSNLEKNQNLKYVLLEETPWVRDAKSESESKRRLGVLLDFNRMASELKNALIKLKQMQNPNGGWPWFEGMRDNRYITQHIVTGFARLNKLGVVDLDIDKDLKKLIRNAVYYLDNRINEDYTRLKENSDLNLSEDHLGYTQIQYLYARSYFMKMFEISKRNKAAFNYFKDQADKYWLNQDIYMQGMISLALNRYGYKTTPSDIIKSLKEKSLHSEEMGMYWRSNNGWYWYQAPVERQALLIEAFDEVANDEEAVEEMKVWLLKQKQTQNWETTKATVDAIYALLLRGTDLLAGDELVEITLGSVKVDPYQRDDAEIEAGTGYFQTSWMGGDIQPDMGKVTLVKKDKGIAWGALYWQYYEDLDKITPHKTPLSLERKLFIERNTASGPVIEEISEDNTLEIGDKVIVRIILRSDRDMEYIHLKDMRAATFEPVNVLSGFKYQGGLGYYESTRDASTNFFVDYLAKGTYVFEYPLIVSQEGDFSNGISTIQCMYAPEFSSHSEGVRVVVN